MLSKLTVTYFPLYTYTKSLCCGPRTNTMFYINYISTNWKKHNMKKMIVTSFIRLLVELIRTMNENYLAWDSP